MHVLEVPHRILKTALLRVPDLKEVFPGQERFVQSKEDNSFDGMIAEI